MSATAKRVGKGRRDPWRLIGGALLAVVGLGCSPRAPSTTPTMPPPPPPRERVVTPDPQDAAAGLGPIVLLEPVPPASESHEAASQLSAILEGGVLSMTTWPTGPGRVWPAELCEDDESRAPFCRMISFGAFREGSLPRAEIASWSGPMRSPVAWGHLFAGAQRAFGVTMGDRVAVDRVDIAGNAVRLGEGPPNAISYSREVRALDLGERVLVLFFDPWSAQPLRLMDFPTAGEGKGGPPGFRMTGFYPMHPSRGVQQSFGYVAAATPLLGEPAVAAWQDGSGHRDGTWVLLSRDLPDSPASAAPAGNAGVTKRTLLLRMKIDGTVVARRVLGTSKRALPELEELHLRVVDDMVVVGNQRFDGKLRPVKGAAPSPPPAFEGAPPKPVWKSPPFERVVAAGYDAFRAEGVAVVNDASGSRAVRFDALGRPLGGATPVMLPAEGKRFRPLLSGDTWVLAPESTLTAFSLALLTGPHAGAVLSAPMPGKIFATAVFARDDVHLVAARFGPLEENGDALHAEISTADIDLATPSIGPWSERSLPLELSDVTAVLAAVHGAPGAMRWIARRSDGSLVVLRGLPDAGLAVEGAPLFGPGALRPRARVYETWSDSVVRIDVMAEDHVTWLTSGLTLPVTDHPTQGRNEPLTVPGPLLAGGVLPPTAGVSSPVSDDVVTALPGCEHAVATGPRRAVLLCGEPVTKDAPSRRVGTRVVRW